MIPNPPGPQTRLDDKMIENILEAIPKVIVMKHVAQLNNMNESTLRTWLKRGEREIAEGREDTIYVKLIRAYNKRRSEVLQEKLNILAGCPRNYGAITWILEKCFKDDFEVMSESHKQLLDWVENVIKPLLGKGAPLNGEETEERREETEEEAL